MFTKYLENIKYSLALKLLRLDPVSDGVTAIGTTPFANWQGDRRLLGLFFELAIG